MEALLETKIFKVSVERLLLNGGQTLYMVGIALLIGTVIGTLLALVLVLCRKGGLVENKVLHSIVSLYINVVRSVPFIILLVSWRYPQAFWRRPRPWEPQPGRSSAVF